MGQQINFYLHPDDYQDFEDLLIKASDAVFLPYYHYDNKVSTVDITIPVDMKKEGRTVYLARPQDLKQIELTHIEKFGYWLVADNRSPVLHYDRCSFDNGKIIKGRLYFQPSFVKDMKSINKSDDFVSWSNNIINTAKRNLKKYKFDMGGWGFSGYTGKQAKEWLDNTKSEKQLNDSMLVSI